jgi:lipoprotein-anchoring transpeptidase ErfK/SrfK
MKSWMIQSLITTAATVAAVAATQGCAQTTRVATHANVPVRVIVVSLEDHKLALLEDGQVKKQYVVAVGKPSTPSPEGDFTIQRRVANPTYQHNGKIIAPGPNNPVGTRWMGLSKAGYGIHGTNEPNSIGKSASHGCIRMGKADLEEFYKLVAIGDRVEIIGHRNEETAVLFETRPAVVAAPAMQQAKTEPAATEAPATTRLETTPAPTPAAGSR